jgi:saccharopine dehydrogenase (NAD+, L-lysine forming)
MIRSKDILVVGGYGAVGRRLAAALEATHPGCVVVAGRNPAHASVTRTRRVDVDDPASIESALDGIAVVVSCVRQRQPHLLRAAIRRGIGYTTIAPPWLPWTTVESLRVEARQSGARIVLATGLEPGISSVLARVGAERLGTASEVETALMLSVGDAYGADSMAFLLEEIGESYTVLVDGREQRAHAFALPRSVVFPEPIGPRRAYTMPFRDQLYYPMTLGAKTSVARLALDPPWLGAAVAMITHLGARSLTRRADARGALHRVIERLRQRYAHRDHFALVVEVRGGGRVMRSTLVGRVQAQATALGAAAVVEALHGGEVNEPGVWLAEQVIAPSPFLARLAAGGLVPVTEEVTAAPAPSSR